ncbi:MAG: hypothetical protein ACXW1Y_06865, partial [Acidimicrobiia bacterium]
MSISEPDHATANAERGPAREVLQQLRWGEIRQERESVPDTMFTTTGRRLYVIGDIDGGFRPRSNAYDLHTFGEPQKGDPLA